MKARGMKIGAIMFFALVLSTGLAGFRPAKLVEESVLVMDISGDVPEAVPYNPLWGLFSPPPLRCWTRKCCCKKRPQIEKLWPWWLPSGTIRWE